MDEGALQVEKIFWEEEINVLEIPYYPRSISVTLGTALTIQVLTTPLMIQALVTPVTTQAPIPPLCNNSKAVPWEYNMVYILGKKYECPLVADKNITNILGAINMTHSGRIFSPPPPYRLLKKLTVMLWLSLGASKWLIVNLNLLWDKKRSSFWGFLSDVITKWWINSTRRRLRSPSCIFSCVQRLTAMYWKFCVLHMLHKTFLWSSLKGS